MDLTPLYDLRDRLKAGAVAGTGLITEDFRLTRALDALAPLEKASPVFAKLGQGTRALLAPDCPDRAAALLDVLSLCDAVLTTQAAVTVPGTVEPLELRALGAALTNAPYSVLSPLMEALTTPGGGRYSFVVDTHDQRPALFRDYRVKNALVTALGASYSELADKAEEWLSQEDENILPLLTQGFDPKGKKEMVRRIHVMEAVAGAKANDFYLGLLDGAEKDVRAAAVYALRHTEENAERLVTLARTERGASKKMAHWALSRLDSPIVWDYWAALAAKHPEQAADYMVFSTTEQTSDLVGTTLSSFIAPYEADPNAELTKEQADQLQRLLLAMPGKSGPAVCDCYRRMAALGTALDKRTFLGPNQKAVDLRLSAFERSTAVVFSVAVPLVLQQALLFHPTPDLLALSQELEQTCETSFAIPALTAALLTKPAGEVFDLVQPFLKPPVSIFRKQQQKEARSVIQHTLGKISWDGSANRQVLAYCYWDPAQAGAMHRVIQPLYQPLDKRIYEELLRKTAGNDYTQLLFGLIPESDPEMCAYLGKEFYFFARFIDDNRAYLEPLVRCGWTECEGLAVHYCEAKGRISQWELQSYLTRMPGDARAKAAELERVIGLIENNVTKLQPGNIKQLKQWVLDYQNTAPVPTQS